MRRRSRLTVAWIVLLVGAMLSAFGILELRREIELSADGDRATGKVIDYVPPQWSHLGASADLEVGPPLAEPVRVHIEHALLLQDWRRGMTLRLVCTRLATKMPVCQIDTFATRWLEPALLLIVGLPAVLLGGFLL